MAKIDEFTDTFLLWFLEWMYCFVKALRATCIEYNYLLAMQIIDCCSEPFALEESSPQHQWAVQ